MSDQPNAPRTDLPLVWFAVALVIGATGWAAFVWLFVTLLWGVLSR